MGIGGSGETWERKRPSWGRAPEFTPRRAELTTAVENTRATLRRWSPEKGFGFATLEAGGDIFVHVHSLCAHVRGRLKSRFVSSGLARDTFDLGRTPMREVNEAVIVGRAVPDTKGLRAENIRCDECSAPVPQKAASGQASSPDAASLAKTTFTEHRNGGRWFLCVRNHSVRMTTADYRRYQVGESVELVCTCCPGRGKGTVQKSR